MSVRQRIVAIVGALAMLGASLSTGLGYDNHDTDLVATSSITILPGDPLTAILVQASSMDDRSENPPITTVAGSMILRVRDERGYATGWTLSLGARDFTGPSGHLGTGLLGLSPGATTVILGNPDLTGLSVFDIPSMGTRSVMFWTAADAHGDGHYEMVIDAALGLPGESRAGYRYTFIVNIDGSAP